MGDKIVNGNWSIVNSRWSMVVGVGGPRSTVHSPQSVSDEVSDLISVYDLELRASSLMKMVDGGWSMVDSQWSMVNGWIKVCVLLFAFCFLLASCVDKKESALPILGERIVEGTDTVYHTIPNFQFVDQDSNSVTNETFKDKIYVADFFFTSCRTICPIMKTQMLRVYDSIKNDADVLLLSHTIDPEYDTVALLRDFANRLGVKSSTWHFVTGVKDSIYHIAQTGYFATAMEDKSVPDGFIHSGAFLLIDKEKRIRGKYDGTKEDDVNRLLADIAKLKKEYAN